MADQPDLPPEFDPAEYRARHADLQSMDAAELAGHWPAFGIGEGRVASEAALRERFVEIVQAEDRVLEIGPFFRPGVAGPNVRYFDVQDSESLARWAAYEGLQTDGIPNIDYVSPDGDMSVVGESFSALFSSHCIEHHADLIGHLAEAARLLPAGGRYYMVVPDKRYCYDHAIPQSTLADVRRAHAEGRRRPGLMSVVEHYAFTTHNDCIRHWAGDHFDPDYRACILPIARFAADLYARSEGQYIDAHCWQFTPESFREILTALHDAGESPFGVTRVYQTPHNRAEFTAVLTRAG